MALLDRVTIPVRHVRDGVKERASRIVSFRRAWAIRKGLDRRLDMSKVETRHSFARTDELDQRFEQTLARIDEQGKRIDDILRRVQAS